MKITDYLNSPKELELDDITRFALEAQKPNRKVMYLSPDDVSSLEEFIDTDHGVAVIIKVDDFESPSKRAVVSALKKYIEYL